MKNNWLIIKSEGEIEIGAITLLGASSKRGDSTKIGFFGSGLKYAIALMTRKNILFCIMQGEKEIQITQEKTSFRDKDFNQILINGEKTSYTSEMGVDWKPWMVVRELYSNALDEPNCTLKHEAEKPIGQTGWTTIGIFMTDDFNDFCERPELFFTDFREATDLLYSSAEVSIYKSFQNLVIYRKGIQAHFEDKPWLFNYDFQSVEINETRVLKNEWYTKTHQISQALIRCDDAVIISKILAQIQYCGEAACDWDYSSYNHKWLEVIGDRWLIPIGAEAFLSSYMNEPYIIMPASMVDGLSKSFGDKVKIPGGNSKTKFLESKIKTSKEIEMLESALLFLSDAETPITYPVLIGEFESKDTLGMADIKSKQIFISKKTFDRGMKELVCTLLEEQVHIEAEVGDFTRAMQNELIFRWVNALESKVKRFL